MLAALVIVQVKHDVSTASISALRHTGLQSSSQTVGVHHYTTEIALKESIKEMFYAYTNINYSFTLKHYFDVFVTFAIIAPFQVFEVSYNSLY